MTTCGLSHAGSIATSARLQATLAVLQDGLRHTTLEIAQRTRSVAVHSDIHGLRQNGCDVRSRREGRVYYYWLESNKGSSVPPPVAGGG